MRSSRGQDVKTVPSEGKQHENSAVVSALINMICPDCGGAMLDFRCRGECCRDWKLEWDLLRLSNSRRRTLPTELDKHERAN